MDIFDLAEEASNGQVRKSDLVSASIRADYDGIDDTDDTVEAALLNEVLALQSAVDEYNTWRNGVIDWHNHALDSYYGRC